MTKTCEFPTENRSRKMPKTVWLLTENDMWKFQFDGPGCRHCLLGWATQTCETYPYSNNYKLNKFKNAIYKAMSEVISCGMAIVAFNDEKKYSKEFLARVWNRAMYLLGYTEGNPESKSLEK